MIAEITAIGSAVASSAKALKGLLDTVEDVESRQVILDIQGQLIDTQTKLLAVQAEYQTLTDAKREIEQQLIANEKWDSEAARYELKAIAPGIFVYVLKADHANSEPSHWICPACFQERKKSILQKPIVDYLNHRCPRCAFDVVPTPVSMPRGDYPEATYSDDF